MSQGESPRDADVSDIEIESIQSKLPNWIILFTSLSFCLALLAEAIASNGFMLFLRSAFEIIWIAVLTFSQEKMMTDIRFRLKKLFAINITMWIFGKIVFYSGKVILEGDSVYRGYCFFLISQVIYHMGEFYFTVTCHINLLSWDSFLINHSKAYGIAQVACHSEFWIEVYFFPSLKDHLWIIILGIILSAAGHILRIGAFMTAMSNFTHLIQHEKRATHQLVTHGIYSISRHPSYLGWFLSTVGGQLLLINPICFVGFTCAAWYFFYDRILYEEYTLYKFFGNAYMEYMKKTPIGIPLLQHFIDKARRKNS